MKIKELREKRNKYKFESMRLQESYMSEKIPFEKCRELKEQQDKIYKKFKFYDNMIKELEKHSKN